MTPTAVPVSAPAPIPSTRAGRVLRAFEPPRAQLWLLAALFVLSLPLVTTRIYASDEVQYFAYLRSLWFDHDVSFENEYQHFYDAGVVRYPGFHETFLERQTETGRRLTFATIGSALLWSPFYAAADGYVRVGRMLGSNVPADGYAQPYVSAVAYGSAVYAWLALVCGWLIARRVLRADGRAPAHADTEFATRERAERARDTRREPDAASRAGLFAALAVWVGTPLFFYMYIAPPMAHACSAFAVAAFVLVWLHARERWCLRGLILLGALAGLMGMVREQDLFIAIGPALDWALTVWRRASGGMDAARPISAQPGAQPAVQPDARPDTPSVATLLWRGAAGAGAFAVAYAPQLAAYVALNGYLGPSRLVVRKMNFAAPHALGVLASPEHGLVFWTPLVVLALLGLVWLLVRKGDAVRSAATATGAGDDARRIALCVLVMIASQIYIAGSVESWTVAGAFGQRRFVGLSALLVLGLAAFIRGLGSPLASDRDRWPRRAGLAAVALAVWWNLGLMAQFGAGLMDRQRLELGRNTYNTFVTVPLKVPELAYRYVFARRSFYRPAGAATPPDAPGASESDPRGSADARTPAAGDAAASPRDGRPR